MYPWAPKRYLGGPLLCKGPSKDHLTAQGYPGFVVESNIYNINVDLMLLTSLLHGAVDSFLTKLFMKILAFLNCAGIQISRR